MTEIITFREDDETIKKIYELARQKMRSRSEIVRIAVRDYVNRRP